MKKVISFVFMMVLFIQLHASLAPPDSIGTKKINGKDYIIHKVKQSESWFNIARSYGITYSELRLANKDSSDKLEPGRLIYIPTEKLKPDDPHYKKNYIQKEPLHYNVKEGETLFSIARKFDTSVENIKKWNSLSSDALIADQRLIVGYRDNSTKEVPSVTHQKLGTTASPGKKDTTTTVIKTASGVSPSSKANKKPVLAQKERKEITESGVASWIRDEDINPNKYYALHRTAPNGTIIKVKNKMNNKYVFVKVVGVLPETGDNKDLVIKISKASAEKLGIRDLKFQSELTYGLSDSK